MKLQPIIRVKLAKFREDYELQSVSDGIAFERFANQIILSTHQPGAFSFALLTSEGENSQNAKRIFLRKVVI